MNLMYQNETLYIDIYDVLTEKGLENLQIKLFRILREYGINKIIMTFHHDFPKKLIDDFKKAYYHNFRGYLTI